MRNGSELRPRMTVKVDGALCRVLSADYHTPGTDNVWKEAKLENGVEVMVPPFIDVGETIRVDVEAGRDVERAKARGR